MNAAAIGEKLPSNGDERNAAGATVLVVEDYDDLRFALTLAMKMNGYRVVEAVDGEEAVELARREHPDLILMDLNLPVVDGFTATRRIREQAETSEVPIVAVTANGTPNYRHKALAAGCNDFLTKPIDLDRLEQKVESMLAHR